MRRQGLLATGLILVLVQGGWTQDGSDRKGKIPAFPGAEGFGAYSVGGRGGRVIEVTHTRDSGPGSFRAAVEAEGPRIVVFRTGGTIELTSRIGITHPYITIAGQTAPGGGIALKYKGEFNIESSHDVVIRHVRFRHSDANTNQDAVNILHGSHDIILDHCSVSWGTDENVSVITRTHDVTLQWCIISEGVLDHSMGSLISSGARNVSVHHCLYAHNSERSAKLRGDPEKLEGKTAYFDFVNNVVYNWNGMGPSVSGSGKANMVANFLKKGPNTKTWPRRAEIVLWQSAPGRSLFAERNIGPSCPEAGKNNWDAGMISEIGGKRKTRESESHSAARHPAPRVTTVSAAEAYEQVLAGAGATRPVRDAVDRRIVEDVKKGTGKFIKSVSEVGGWPELAAGTPPPDRDHDGMPDEWEKKHGLKPDDASDGPRDADGDGYTNVEEFLNGTDPRSDR